MQGVNEFKMCNVVGATWYVLP